jgi:hypothetical protein
MARGAKKSDLRLLISRVGIEISYYKQKGGGGGVRFLEP